jgi:hypothetical protein
MPTSHDPITHDEVAQLEAELMLCVRSIVGAIYMLHEGRGEDARVSAQAGHRVLSDLVGRWKTKPLRAHDLGNA